MHRLLWILAVVVACACLLFLLRSSNSPEPPATPVLDDHQVAETGINHVTTAPPEPEVLPAKSAPRLSPSHSIADKAARPKKLIDLAFELGDADPLTDLEIVGEMFHHYQRVFRANPVGENYEITAALLGDNAKGLAYIPADHPALNEFGELCDRWGNPYWFHSLSGTEMDVVSRGPDGKLHTPDDVKLR